MDHQGTLSSAMAYAGRGRLEEWVHAYLLSDGHNKAFSDGLKLLPRFYLGPVSMPLSLLSRCCGPEEGMKYRVDETGFLQLVEKLMQAIKDDRDMPPLIVHYVDGEFELNDGNHRFEAYKRLGVTECPTIIWITEERELADFRRRYPELTERG